MIKAILIDDEPNALEVLEWQLQMYCPQISIAALCSSADQGLAAIHMHHPQLVFLDIEMPVKNGFEVLKAFDELPFDVIFTTAYNQYAIKAIKLAAFDYLVKPIDAEDLKASIGRYERRKDKPSSESIKMLMEQLKPPAQRIALHTSEGMMMLKPEDIIRCQSVSNYSNIYLQGGRKIVVSKTLKEVEETLAGYGFYRIHHSHLANLSHVQRYVKGDGGYVVMSDGEEITIARNRKDGFMEQFARI